MSNVEIHTEFSHWEKYLYSDTYYLVGNSTSELPMLEQKVILNVENKNGTFIRNSKETPSNKVRD